MILLSLYFSFALPALLLISHCSFYVYLRFNSHLHLLSRLFPPLTNNIILSSSRLFSSLHWRLCGSRSSLKSSLAVSLAFYWLWLYMFWKCDAIYLLDFISTPYPTHSHMHCFPRRVVFAVFFLSFTILICSLFSPRHISGFCRNFLYSDFHALPNFISCH